MEASSHPSWLILKKSSRWWLLVWKGSLVSSLSRSGLLLGEGEEVRGIGPFSLNCDFRPLRSSRNMADPFHIPGLTLKSQPFHHFRTPPHMPTSHLLPRGESLCSCPRLSPLLPFCSLSQVNLPSSPGPGSAFHLCSAPRIPQKPVSRMGFTWHGECQDLETESPFWDRVILCCGSYNTALWINN